MSCIFDYVTEITIGNMKLLVALFKVYYKITFPLLDISAPSDYQWSFQPLSLKLKFFCDFSF